MSKKFPLDDTTAAAHSRGEAILALYTSAGMAGDFAELLTGAIADLAILADIEAGVSRAEAAAEGDPHGGSGLTARLACEDGADLAEDILESERLEASRGDGGLYDEVTG